MADGLGVTRAARHTAEDAAALRRLRGELDEWADRERTLFGKPPPHRMPGFLRLLAEIAATSAAPRLPVRSGCVRLLPAGEARHLPCDHLFVLGLGERGFPNFGGPEPLFDGEVRDAMRGVGLDLLDPADRPGDEMLLFFQLCVRPRRELVLSHPAVDDKGQSLLSSPFLARVLSCFADGAVPIERKRMPIEGFDRERPLSPAEYRVRWAAGGLRAAAPSPELDAHLRLAKSVAFARFEDSCHGPYDGVLRDGAALEELAAGWGAERVYSPTALEHYVACPFRFFLGHVLKLEPLAEPAEEVEQTRRGAAFHRALTRLHTRLQAAAVHEPTDAIAAELRIELDAAVAEYASRSSSPAAKSLWSLEGQRLHRSVARYAGHWAKFREPWVKAGVEPRPHRFEADFGLPAEADAPPGEPLVVEFGGVRVRVGGRIDRVDVADIDGGRGFWVIDYKTGKGPYYTAGELRSMQKLQLALYAVAVERVLLAGGAPARPLGLAYWLLTDAGPRIALPGRKVTEWLTGAAAWPEFRARLEGWVARVVGHARAGDFPLSPRSDHCTDTCRFGQVCRIAQSRGVEKEWDLALPDADADGGPDE